jgi:hypothetical protein
MAYGRLIRVKTRRGDPNATVYVVAETDASKAMDVIRVAGIGQGDDFEDLGRVSDYLIKALAVQPGTFIRA